MAEVASLLLDALDEAFDRKSWHGPNLRAAVRGVSARQAAWRPAEGAHNIWEFTLHAAYWKYVVRRKITGGKRGSFPVRGSNFFTRPVELTEAAWKADIDLLVVQHQELRLAIGELSPARIAGFVRMIRGAAAHDLYHAGQIRLMRRLCPEL